MAIKPLKTNINLHCI